MTDNRTPEAYRGIPVPAELANRATSIEWHMWRLAVTGVLDVVVPLLERFESDDACSIDHNGICQEHWSGGDGHPCRVAEVTRFLDLANHDECVWAVHDLAPRSLYWCYQHRPKGIHTTMANLTRIADLPDPLPYERRTCVDCGRDIIGR
jgi:hypothetical protein